MAPLPSTDLLVGIGALAVAAVAIYLFIRASGAGAKKTEPEAETIEEETTPLQVSPLALEEGRLKLPKVERHLRGSDVERARSDLRTLTLKTELLTMVLKRLFEAEDEGEITREERIRLSRGYEADMKRLSGELKQAELVVTLNELEAIRDDILKKFEATLNETQAKIDTILKELKLKEPKKAPAKPPRRRKPEKEEEVEEAEEEKPQPPRRRRPEVEEKLEQLRREVLKELEELEKLEIEA